MTERARLLLTVGSVLPSLEAELGPENQAGFHAERPAAEAGKPGPSLEICGSPPCTALGCRKALWSQLRKCKPVGSCQPTHLLRPGAQACLVPCGRALCKRRRNHEVNL